MGPANSAMITSTQSLLIAQGNAPEAKQHDDRGGDSSEARSQGEAGTTA
jgi:hypothetical protein